MSIMLDKKAVEYNSIKHRCFKNNQSSGRFIKIDSSLYGATIQSQIISRNIIMGQFTVNNHSKTIGKY